MKTTRDWQNWQRKIARLPPRPVATTAPDEPSGDNNESRCIVNDTDTEGEQ